jgi:Icc-related predicted phosphoesterase
MEATSGPSPAPTADGTKLRVAAMGDLHVHKVHHGEWRPVFAEISQAADVLVLCGDLTAIGLVEEAEHLAMDLAALKVPALAVLGNHDLHSGKEEEVRAALRKAGVRFLDEESVDVGEVGFAGVKGFGGGFGDRMLAPFGEETTKAFVTAAVNEGLSLETQLKGLLTARRVVVLHYSPIAETVKGEPAEIYPFMGCSRLAETIDRFDVAAVFHGHAHHGTHAGKTLKGTPVYNVSAELLKKQGRGGYVVVEV